MSKKVKQRAVYGFPNITAHKSISNNTEKIESHLKSKIKKLQHQGINSTIYQQYLDSIVDTYTATQINTLEHNHNLNLRHIEHTFQRRASDKAEYERMIQLIEEEMIKTEEELKFVELLYSKFNPLHRGKFINKGIAGKCEFEED